MLVLYLPISYFIKNSVDLLCIKPTFKFIIGFLHFVFQLDSTNSMRIIFVYIMLNSSKHVV